MAEFDGSIPISNVRTMDQILDGSVGGQRFVMTLLTVFGLLALLLAAIGVYGVISYAVSQRTHEIGLRMALGARRRDILRQFLIEAVTLSMVGGAIGVTAGIAGSIGIANLGEWPVIIRPQSAVLAFAFAAAVGIFFGYYPARKASRLDPIDALRYE